MPITVRLDPSRAMLVAECVGSVTRLEINVAMVEAMHTPAYADGAPMLIDARRMLDLPSAATLQDFADMVHRAAPPPGSRRAILTATPAAYGIARMLEAYTDGARGEYRAFRSLREALEWLRPGRATDRELPSTVAAG